MNRNPLHSKLDIINAKLLDIVRSIDDLKESLEPKEDVDNLHITEGGLKLIQFNNPTVSDLITALQTLPQDYNVNLCGVSQISIFKNKTGIIQLDETKWFEENENYLLEYQEE